MQQSEVASVCVCVLENNEIDLLLPITASLFLEVSKDRGFVLWVPELKERRF